MPTPKRPRRTAERILEVTLDLFNRFGEPNVSTTLISAELNISPGNLYYHFRNKQAIIAELFAEYESHVESFLRLPEGRGLTVDDKTFYLEALLAAMWRYSRMLKLADGPDEVHKMVIARREVGRFLKKRAASRATA